MDSHSSIQEPGNVALQPNGLPSHCQTLHVGLDIVEQAPLGKLSPFLRDWIWRLLHRRHVH